MGLLNILRYVKCLQHYQNVIIITTFYRKLKSSSDRELRILLLGLDNAGLLIL